MKRARNQRIGNQHSRRRGPEPGYKKRRVIYRVEKLPEEVRALVDRGLAQGRSFDQIRQEVIAAGDNISRNALQNYWRNRWRHENRRLHWINSQAQALAAALRQGGESNEAVLVRKMLFAAVLERMKDDLKEVDISQLLRASQEMVKATRHLMGKSAASQPRLSPEEIQRKVREIYGWPEEELAARENKQDS